MSSVDHACDAVDLVAATISPAVGVLEDGVFVEDLVDGCASTRWVVFPEYIF